MKAYLYFACDPYLEIKDIKDMNGWKDYKQVEIDPEDYIVYKGLLIQFDRLQEKLFKLREQR